VVLQGPLSKKQTGDKKEDKKENREDASKDAELVAEELLPVESSVETDPETVARVQSTSTSTLVTFRDGSTLARFRDGTTIRQDPTKVHVLVENSSGFPSVLLDCAVDRTARKHARGEKVPVSTGGERIRTRVALPDGSKVLCTYNTRVTSDVRGKLVLVCPDFSEVVAADSPQVDACTVSFRPRGVWVGGEEKARGLVPGDAIEAAVAAARDLHQGYIQGLGEGIGCYEFNLFHGRMVTEDSEHNVFFASVNPEKVEKNEKGATYDVDLAGKLQGDDVKAEAVVNDPMPPRLFVVNRDGTATEFLRPKDVADFRRLASLGALQVTSTVGEPLATDPADKPATQHVHHIHITRPTLSTFASAFPDSAQVSWHQYPLPVCSRSAPDTHPRAPAHVIAPRITLRRVWVQVSPLDKSERAALVADLERCEAFRVARELSVNRFAVLDDRSASELDAEAAIRKHLKKALKQANAKKKAARAKSSAKEARSMTAAEGEDDEANGDAGDVKSASGDGVDVAETESVAFYAEVKAAFADRAGEGGGFLGRQNAVDALVQVCNRAVSEAEAADLWGQGAHATFDEFLGMARRASQASLDLEQESGAACRQEEVKAKALAFGLSLGRSGKGSLGSAQLSESKARSVKPGAFWASATGRQLLADGLPMPPAGGEPSPMAVGGGMNAARAASKRRNNRIPGGGSTGSGSSIGNAGPESPLGKGPEALVAGTPPGPTFKVFPEFLELDSVAAPSALGGEVPVVTGFITLSNVSPFAARFRVRGGSRGLARLVGKEARPGPVPAGESVRLKVELRSDDEGLLAEDEIAIVSEHQEIIVPVIAEVYRTKPR